MLITNLRLVTESVHTGDKMDFDTFTLTNVSSTQLFHESLSIFEGISSYKNRTTESEK